MSRFCSTFIKCVSFINIANYIAILSRINTVRQSARDKGVLRLMQRKRGDLSVIVLIFSPTNKLIKKTRIFGQKLIYNPT